MIWCHQQNSLSAGNFSFAINLGAVHIKAHMKHREEESQIIWKRFCIGRRKVITLWMTIHWKAREEHFLMVQN
jgi:hypothetical protein